MKMAGTEVPSGIPHELADGWLGEEAVRWFRGYLVREHPLLGRGGAVCPFVEPALRVGTVLLEVHRVGADVSRSGLTDLVRKLVESFRGKQWPHRNRTLHALVGLLPGLSPTQLAWLDEVQAEVKPSLAEEGLMLGQFHERCREPAARNPDFPVSRSPVPMLAVRHMALHDVLFLHSGRRGFLAYRDRFGHLYRRHPPVDPLFVELYHSALDRFRVSDGISAAITGQ
jgi:heptaprenyl diphosphate synthase